MQHLTAVDFYFSGPDVEGPECYRPGGYHPVHLGDVYHEKYRVIHKLGFGTYSTVWLARDLQAASQTRYVALKFAVAELSGIDNEIMIHRHLAPKSGTHPGSEHVIALLDHFKVEGPNGTHDVLVLQIVGPRLGAMFDDDPDVVREEVNSLAHQITLGTSFLHHCGVVHADLHKGNITFEVPDLDGKPEEDVMGLLGVPMAFVPVITRNPEHQTKSLPKYLVIPGSLVDFVAQENMRVKIIDFGEAFFSDKVPQYLHSPLTVRAPEGIVNRLLTPPAIRYTTLVDAWSVGCLIYELSTLTPLIREVQNERMILKELTSLGPLPQEWIESLGESYSPGGDVDPLNQRIEQLEDVTNKQGLIALLQRILVIDPLRRSELSDVLDDPWFVGTPRATAPAAFASE